MADRTVDGELNVAWTSDLKTRDYNDMSETVDATPKEDQGEQRSEYLPSHLDKEDLTDKQYRAITLAVQNPTMTASAIDDKIGSQQYANQILKDKVPEFYQDVFKQNGNSKKHNPYKNKKRDTSPNTSDETDAEDDVEENTTNTIDRVKIACETIQATTTNDELESFAEHIQTIAEDSG